MLVRDGTSSADLAATLDEHHQLLHWCLGCLESAADAGEADLEAEVRQLVGIVVRTFVAEETFLHPLLASTPDGVDVIEQLLHDHDEAEAQMELLLTMEPTDPRFDPHLRGLVRMLREYFRDLTRQLGPARRVPVEEPVARLVAELSSVVKARVLASTDELSA